MQNDEIVCLATASNPQEAHTWRQALEDEGIRCQVVGDYLDAGVGDIPGFRAELWVHREDVEKARTLLEAHQGSRAGGGEDEE
jgi:hypothetical protein